MIGSEQEKDWKVVQSKRWGELRIRIEDVIQFPRGLLGFESFKQYAIYEVEEHKPFQWLICLEQPEIAFVIINPLIFYSTYRPKISKRDLKELSVTSPHLLKIYSLVTLSDDPRRVTTNLSGPILLNTQTRLAKQIILLDEAYSTKYPIMPIE